MPQFLLSYMGITTLLEWSKMDEIRRLLTRKIKKTGLVSARPYYFV